MGFTTAAAGTLGTVRLLPGLADFDRFVQTGERESAAQLLAGAHELEVAALLAGPPGPSEEHSEAGVVERGDAVEVDVEGGALVLVDRLEQLVAEVGQGGEVEFTADLQHRLVAEQMEAAAEFHGGATLPARPIANLWRLDGHRDRGRYCHVGQKGTDEWHIGGLDVSDRDGDRVAAGPDLDLEWAQ